MGLGEAAPSAVPRGEETHSWALCACLAMLSAAEAIGCCAHRPRAGATDKPWKGSRCLHGSRRPLQPPRLYISLWAPSLPLPQPSGQGWLTPRGRRAMKAALWALAVGPLLLTLRAVPIGEFLLPSSTEPSGGSSSVDAEVLSVRTPSSDPLPGSRSARRGWEILR